VLFPVSASKLRRGQPVLLFHNVVVGMRAKIKRAIIDKGVRIPDGMRIGYDLEKDRERFFVSDEGISGIPKGEVL
jgi:glucose-1-phosphate adenylyltransferase